MPSGQVGANMPFREMYESTTAMNEWSLPVWLGSRYSETPGLRPVENQAMGP
jgi:hypothetical protein